MKRLLVVVMLVASAVTVSAQGAPQGQPQPAQQQRRDKIKQRIRALRAYTLTEQLELDEATAAKLFPALAKYDDEFDKLLAARADLQKRLEGAGAIKDSKAVDKLIDDAVANQRAIWDTEGKRLEQLRKILTPAQVARTLVVLPAMERKIQNQLRKAVQKRGGGGGGGGGRTVDPFDDDFDKRDGSADDNIDPFDSGKPARKKAAPAKEGAPCDPFASGHGCSK